MRRSLLGKGYAERVSVGRVRDIHIHILVCCAISITVRTERCRVREQKINRVRQAMGVEAGAPAGQRSRVGEPAVVSRGSHAGAVTLLVSIIKCATLTFKLISIVKPKRHKPPFFEKKFDSVLMVENFARRHSVAAPAVGPLAVGVARRRNRAVLVLIVIVGSFF